MAFLAEKSKCRDHSCVIRKASFKQEFDQPVRQHEGKATLD
jgi:hypothetical protein